MVQGLVKCFIKTPCPHDAVIRVYDEAGNVIETHGHAAGDFREFELKTTHA